jgi:hypothetical protein
MYRIDYAQVTSTMDDDYAIPVIEEPFFHTISCVPLQEVHDRVRVHASGTYPVQWLTKAYFQGGSDVVGLTGPGVRFQQKLDCLVLTFYRMLAVIGHAYEYGMESVDIDRIMTQHHNEAAITHDHEEAGGSVIRDPIQLEIEDALEHYSNPVHKPPTEAIVLWAKDLGVHEYPVVLPSMVNGWNSPVPWWNREQGALESYTRGTVAARPRAFGFIDHLNATIAGWMSGQHKHVARRAIFKYFGEKDSRFGFEGDVSFVDAPYDGAIHDVPNLEHIADSYKL